MRASGISLLRFIAPSQTQTRKTRHQRKKPSFYLFQGFVKKIKMNFDRLIFALILIVASWHGLLLPEPLTSSQLRQIAKQKSISKVCDKPRKTKTVKELCAKWEK